jgi:hypothetical protein
MEVSQILAMPIDQVFHNLFLPFILAFAILWGALLMMPIFNKKIKLVLAVALSIFIFFTPEFDIFANFLTMLGSQLAIVLFFIVFGFGLLAWTFKNGKNIYHDAAGYNHKMDHLLKRRDELENKARGARNRGEDRLANDFDDEAEKVGREIERMRRNKKNYEF